MAGFGRTLMSAVMATGLLVGGAGLSAAAPVTVTVDSPTPKERPTTPGTRPNPFRCDRAEQGLARAEANVARARQRLKAAPKNKKPARRSALKAAKQSRTVAKARVDSSC